MGKLRRIVLDVLKPHEPSIISLAQQLSALPSIDGVDIAVVGVDRQVESVRISVEGASINYEKLSKVINDNGCTIKSIDKASAGTRVVHQPQLLMQH